MSWITAMLEDRISYALPSSASADGDTSYGSTVSDVPARVEAQITRILTAEGEELITSHTIALEYAGALGLPYDTRVWLPGEASPRLVKECKAAKELFGDARLCEVKVT